MKKLILFGGDLASGKSTYSNIIGDKLDILVINKDNLKEILGDNIYASNREENKKLSTASFDLMCYLLKKNKNNVILLESNFKPYEMAELSKLTKEYDYETLSLKFIGDNNVLHQRFNKRLGENRHYVHKSQDFTSLDDFVKTLEELRSVEYIGKNVIVDSTTFDYQKDNNLYNIIKEFIGK